MTYLKISLTLLLSLLLLLVFLVSPCHGANKHEKLISCKDCHIFGEGGEGPGGPPLKVSHSDLCLRCHSESGSYGGDIFKQAYKVYTRSDMASANPAGNYRWTSAKVGSSKHGHSIHASSKGIGGIPLPRRRE